VRHPGIHVEQETHGLGLLRELQELTEVRVGGPVARAGKDLACSVRQRPQRRARTAGGCPGSEPERESERTSS
jgi:hypothetical protein